MAAGFLFRVEGLETQTAFLVLGLAVTAVSVLALAVRFAARDEVEQRRALRRAMAMRRGTSLPAGPAGATASARSTSPVFGD
jgi:hypothetical protein